jgi:putative Mg2+ transporter-C (MgtC) family protein
MQTEFVIIPDWQILIRLLIGALLGAMIGFERERQNQPAGLRTHTILAVGCTLAMTLSINIAMQFREVVPNGDPARLAAQVISGIGFLGAGAILRFGNNIRGLTTATSLWTLAIIGLAVGAGHFVAGVATTLILLGVLSVLNIVEKRLIKTYKTLNVAIDIDDHPGVLDEIRQHIADENTRIIDVSVSRDFTRDVATVNLVIKTLENAPVDELVAHLASLKGIKSFKIN